MFKKRILAFSETITQGRESKTEELERLLREHNKWFLGLLVKTKSEITSLEGELEKNPDDLEARYLLGQTLIDREEYSRAEKELLAVTGRRSGDMIEYQSLSSLGYIEFLKGNYDTAMYYIGKAISVAEEKNLYPDKEVRDFDHLTIADCLKHKGLVHSARRYLREKQVEPKLFEEYITISHLAEIEERNKKMAVA